MSLEIAVIGTRFGGALARSLHENGIPVVVFSSNPAKVKTDPGMTKLWLANIESFRPKDFRYVVVALPFELLEGFFANYRWPEEVTVVLVQKGLQVSEGEILGPTALATRHISSSPILFTGAAFAKDLANGHQVGMILAGDHERICGFKANLNVTSVWPVITDQVREVEFANGLRTIISLMQGMTAGFLDHQGWNSESTIALAYAAIADEYRRIRRYLSQNPVPEDVERILTADLSLCCQQGSRNYHAGYLLGTGMVVEKVLTETAGVAESIHNTLQLGLYLDEQKIPQWKEDNPYLSNALLILQKGPSVLFEAFDSIMRRRQRRF